MRYLMGAMVALLALLAVLLWWNRDPSIKAAAKLALAGKHTEAEALIRAEIEAKGPTERRLTVLGLLLMDQKRLEESLQVLQEAQRLAKQPATAKNNCAIVLWKLGRREEAAILVDEVCAQDPNNFTGVCNSCLILAELGRETPAVERLRQAERIFARYDFSHTKSWVPLLDECRKAVPAAQGFPVILPRGGEAANTDTRG
jgi:Flp pilus assembly protein TadD